MRNVSTITVCDFPHLDDTPAAETIDVQWRKVRGRLDTCAAHAAEADRLLGPVLRALAAQKPAAQPAARRGARRPASSRRRSGEIRAWLAEHGHQVHARGRIPADLVALFDAATS